MPHKFSHAKLEPAKVVDTKADGAQETNMELGRSAQLASPRAQSAMVDGTADSKAETVGLLGRFRLEQELGRGAFGVVYRAHDPQLDRTIALKLPRLGADAGPRKISRFMLEAKSAANLHHPNIVAVHDAGCIGQQYYIASSFVNGCTLREMMQSEGRPSQRSAVKLLIRLVDALAYAHGEGVIHRDIKPENILLSEEGVPYITDFGLARREANDVLQTREGTLLGTPAYMSPEQAEGKTSLVDARSDQWALGVIMYELLVGRRPFEGAELQLLYAIRHQDVVSLRQVDPSISRDLDIICQKCLTKEREGRYSDCAALRDDLEHWLNDEAIKVRKPSPLERLGRWHRRNPALARLTGAFVFAVVVGGAAVMTQWYRAEANRLRAEDNADEANRARQVAEDRSREIAEQKQLVESSNKQLATEKSSLQKANEKISDQLEILRNKDAVIEQTSTAKAIAQQRAESELELRRSEERKNLDLRYFGEIHSAKLALDVGQPLLCKTILAATSPEQRSIEHQILGEMANYGLRFELVTDVRKLPPATRDFFLAVHTPLTLSGVESKRLLPSIENAHAVAESGRNFLSVGGSTNWLKDQLPPSYEPPARGEDPAEEMPRLATARVFDLRYSKSMLDETATQAWLSPSGRFLVTTRPTIDRSVPTRLQIGLEVVLREMQVSDRSVEQREEVLHRKSVGALELIERLVPSVAYTWENINFSTWPSLAGAFSADSDFFSAYDPQDEILRTWRLMESGVELIAETKVGKLASVSHSSTPVSSSASGNLLLAGPRSVRVLSAEKHETLLEIDLERSIDESWSVTFSDSHRTLMAHSDDRIELYDLDSGALVLSDQLPTFSADDFQLNAGVRTQAAVVGIPILDWGKLMLAESPDLSWYCVKMAGSKTVKLRNGEDQIFEDRRLFVFRRAQNFSNRAQQTIWKSLRHADLRNLVTSADNRWCVLWNDSSLSSLNLSKVPITRPSFSKELLHGPIRAVDISPAAAQMAVCVGDRVEIMSLNNGAELGVLKVPRAATVRFSTDGRSLLVCDEMGIARMMRIDSGEKTREWSSVRSGTTLMAADRLEQWLVTGGQEQAVRRWRFMDGTSAGHENTEAPVAELKLIEQQQLLIARLTDQSAIVLKWPTLERIIRVHPQSTLLLDVLPTRDSKRVLIARQDATVLLDVKLGTEVLEVSSFANRMVAARFINDGQMMLGLSDDGVLSYLDLTKTKFNAGLSE